jgi:hypothetical protein
MTSEGRVRVKLRLDVLVAFGDSRCMRAAQFATNRARGELALQVM